MPFFELGDELDYSVSLGVLSLGEWVLTIEFGWDGLAEEVIMPLSAGARVVAHTHVQYEDLDHFFWVEDGELRFCFIAQNGFSEPVPDELTETMNVIDAINPPVFDLHQGPLFLLAERITGIKLTRELVEHSTYLGGMVPAARVWRMPSPW